MIMTMTTSITKEIFWTKYIFSQDHKVIAKQFLITGIFWALLGGILSVIFRLQLGFPDMNIDWLKPVLGEWITPEGKLDPEFYLALVTMHGTIMVFFVLTAGLSGTFANFLIPLQIVFSIIKCGDSNFPEALDHFSRTVATLSNW